MTIKVPDYAGIKDAARTQHFDVSEGPIYGPPDVAPTAMFLVGELFKQGVPIDGNTLANTQHGFAFPEFLPESVIGDTVPEGTFSDVPVAPGARSEDGTLLVGEGNPSTGFTVQNSSFAQLGISIRYTKDDQVPDQGSAVFPSTRNGNSWRFAFAVTALGEVKLADLESVKLILSTDTEDPLGGQLVTLSYDAATNVWDGGTFTITDSAANEISVQNIQGYEFPFLRDLLVPALPEGVIPFGNFRISLQAAYQGQVTQLTTFVIINKV